MAEQETNYTQGYSKATVATHASRTVESDAAFLVPYIQPSDRILDVGCGPGSITIGFGALVPRGAVTGVDISDQVLDQARRALSAAAAAAAAADDEEADATAAPRVEFRRADLLAGLPFADASFDVVYSSQLFPHLATGGMRARALGEMRRVLKPGGVLATRDAAALHFYPRSPHDLDRRYADRMARAFRGAGESGGGTTTTTTTSEDAAAAAAEDDAVLPGGDMPALYRRAGFDAARLRVGAGTTVYADAEARRWFAASMAMRLAPGEAVRASWARVGVSDAEIDEVRGALARWAEDDDAWYVALQAEIVAWK